MTPEELVKVLEEFVDEHEFYYDKRQLYTRCTPNDYTFDEYTCQGCEEECDSVPHTKYERRITKLLTILEITKMLNTRIFFEIPERNNNESI